jgi:hypothetical protein
LEAWVFLFASQSPQKVLFCRLQVATPPAISFGSLESEAALQAMETQFPYNFDLVTDEMASQQDLPCEAEQLFILPDLFVHGGRLVSLADLIPLTIWLDAHAGEIAVAEVSTEPRLPIAAKKPSVPSELLRKHAWLKGSMARLATKESQGDDEQSSSDEESAAVCVDDEDFLARALGELYAKRAEWAMEREEMNSFEVVICGGPYLAKHKKLAYDQFRGQPCTAEARDFCRRYGVRMSFSATIAYHGELLASQLCMAWCHKLQYAFDIYCSSGDDSYEFSKEDWAGYTEPLSYLDLVCELEVESATFARAIEIRRLRTSKPLPAEHELLT